MTACRHCMVSRHFVTLALALLVGTSGASLCAQEELVDGADFNALLRAKVKIQQEGLGVRKLAERFRTDSGLAIFLDRRIDPDLLLSLELPEMRLEFALREIALRQRMGVVLRDSYLYLGPAPLCRWWSSELEELSRQVQKLKPPAKSFWQTESPLTWPEGSSPRDLAVQIGGENFPESQSQKISHDIWDAWNGPTLPRWEQLAILCAGFDLIPEIDEKGVATLQPLAAGKFRSELVKAPASEISLALEQVQRYFPEMKATIKQNQLGLEGSSDEIKAIKAWFAAPPPAKRNSSGKPAGPVMALSTPLPVPARELLRTLARELRCELVISPEVPEAAISKSIQPAWKGTRDQMLAKISEAVGLNCQFVEGKIVVTNR